MKNIRLTAERILSEFELMNDLEKFGTPYIIGSYAMDAMSHNDIDIDVSNESMNIKKLHELSKIIITKFSPIWYEAKEEVTQEGKTVWFQGFEAIINNELWNFDIWFFDNETIKSAVNYSQTIKSQFDVNPSLKDIVIQIKKDLIDKGLYSYDKYTSGDVYKSVLENDIRTVEQFLAYHVQQDNTKL